MTEHADFSDHVALTRHLAPLRISEIVLKTSRFEAMKSWYQMVLGVAPFFERKPPAGSMPKADQKALGRASDRRICFMRLAMNYPYAQVLGLFEVPEVEGKPAREPGLDHMQLRNASMKELVERFELLDGIGIRPYRSANHGPGTSFYYTDPDGNRVELSGPNFETEREYLAYFESDTYRRNPSGIEIDPDAYVARFRSGVPLAELVRIPA